MGGYYDYRSYFQDIQDSLEDILTNQSLLLTEIRQQEEERIEREKERHEEINQSINLVTGILLIGAVISVLFK